MIFIAYMNETEARMREQNVLDFAQVISFEVSRF